MGRRIDSLLEKWKSIRETALFHNAVLFLIFVCVSTLFWVILSLNDSAQDSFNVKISINNVPDSVTFISDIPDKFHVGVRDKGTTLWRNHYKNPTVSINFADYSEKGLLKFTKADMESSLKSIFGTNAVITSTSLDSLRLSYTTNKGKRVPVIIESHLSAAIGSVIVGKPQAMPSNVYVFGEQSVLDTIHRVYSRMVSMNDLTETNVVKVKLKDIRNARIVPSTVDVKVTVEPLVKKEALITITPINVPDNESLLLFPSRVPVDYYVAMSRLGDDDDPSIELQVDYNSIKTSVGDKLQVSVISYPERLQNLSLKTDSVEYTLVKN